MNPDSPRTPPKLSIESARQALLKSGYLLEYRLEQVLRSKDFYCEANPIYIDESTQKAREVDLVAGSSFRCSEKEQDDICHVHLRLVVECINNATPLALISKSKGTYPLPETTVRVSGAPLYLWDLGNDKRLVHISHATNVRDWHHYFKSDRYATQYTTFSPKEQKQGRQTEVNWIAGHDNDHYSTIQKLTQVSRLIEEHSFGPKGLFEERADIHLIAPILVLQGELWDVRPEGNDLSIAEISRGLLCQTSFGDQLLGSFAIDVCRESEFDQLVETLMDDADGFANRIGELKDSIVEAYANSRRQMAIDLTKQHIRENGPIK